MRYCYPHVRPREGNRYRQFPVAIFVQLFSESDYARVDDVI